MAMRRMSRLISAVKIGSSVWAISLSSGVIWYSKTWAWLEVR